jgi:hypothetical protein
VLILRQIKLQHISKHLDGTVCGKGEKSGRGYLDFVI